MEQSEIQKELITLGKRLVKQLGLTHSNDTLARWMAHYIAELIYKAENSKGKEHIKYSKECAEQILALWKHRWSFPHGHRPLEDFEPLLNFLQKFDVGYNDPYYYPQIPVFEKPQNAKQTKKEKEVDGWLKIAENMDRVSRIWLQEIFHRAALATWNPVAKAWFENVSILPTDYDRRILINIVTEDLKDLTDDQPAEHLQGRLSRENLANKIEQLKGYAKTNQMLIEIYQNQLDMA